MKSGLESNNNRKKKLNEINLEIIKNSQFRIKQSHFSLKVIDWN